MDNKSFPMFKVVKAGIYIWIGLALAVTAALGVFALVRYGSLAVYASQQDVDLPFLQFLGVFFWEILKYAAYGLPLYFIAAYMVLRLRARG